MDVLHARDPTSAGLHLRSPVHSPKLASLVELMAQCGIIKSTAGEEGDAPGGAVIIEWVGFICVFTGDLTHPEGVLYSCCRIVIV